MVVKAMKDKRLEALEQVVGFDYILETRPMRDFTEYVISMGGDVLTFRVYERDGEYKVYER